MKKMLMFLLCAMGAAVSLRAGLRSIHTVVLCAGGRPDVQAYFGKVGSIGLVTPAHRFVDLIGDPSSQDRAAWQVAMGQFQGLALEARPVIDRRHGPRLNFVDSLGRIRKVVRTSPEGLTTEAALFDVDGHILRLDMWCGQVAVPDSVVRSIDRSFGTPKACGIRVFNSASGNIDTEIRELEYLASVVTRYAVVHGLGLSYTTDSVPSAPSAAAKPLAAASLASISATPKTEEAVYFGQSLAVVPNPASGPAVIFYQLPFHFENIKIHVWDLSGRQQRIWGLGDQNAGSYRIPVELQGLPRGVYFVVLTGDNGAGVRVIGRFKLALLG